MKSLKSPKSITLSLDAPHWIQLSKEWDGEEWVGSLESNLKDGEANGEDGDVQYLAAIDGLETLLLTLYSKGVKVDGPACRNIFPSSLKKIASIFVMARPVCNTKPSAGTVWAIYGVASRST